MVTKAHIAAADAVGRRSAPRPTNGGGAIGASRAANPANATGALSLPAMPGGRRLRHTTAEIPGHVGKPGCEAVAVCCCSITDG